MDGRIVFIYSTYLDAGYPDRFVPSGTFGREFYKTNVP